jgi:hypothetical protein
LIGDEGTVDGAKDVLAAMLAAQQKLQLDLIIHGGNIRSHNHYTELLYGLFVCQSD